MALVAVKCSSCGAEAHIGLSDTGRTCTVCGAALSIDESARNKLVQRKKGIIAACLSAFLLCAMLGLLTLQYFKGTFFLAWDSQPLLSITVSMVIIGALRGIFLIVKKKQFLRSLASIVSVFTIVLIAVSALITDDYALGLPAPIRALTVGKETVLYEKPEPAVIVISTPEPTPTPKPIIIDKSAISPYFDKLPNGTLASLPSEASQLVVVEQDGKTANTYFFEIVGNSWIENIELRAVANIGKNGISLKEKEGDGITPAGLFRIREAFYNRDEPQTGLNLLEITKSTRWVDDPASAYYNTIVSDSSNKDWNSTSEMSGDSYRYGFTFSFNEEQIPGAGSVISVRVGSKATGGAIAINTDDMLAYLKVLSIVRSPYILLI